MAERATSRLGSSVLDLSVDDRAFIKGIKGVANHTKHAHRAFDVMGVKAEKLSGRINNLNKGLKFLAGAGALAGVTAAVLKFTQATVNNIVEIKVLSATAGLSAKAFQEYGFAARQAGISASGLIDGVKELNLRIDEFIQTSYGPGAEAFARLGFDRATLAALDPDDYFDSVIQALDRVEDRAGRLRIADEVFGGTGGEQYERLIRYLRETGQTMTEVRQRAHDLGVVLGDDLVDNTRAIHLKFLELKDVVSTQLARALLDILPPAKDLDRILEEGIPDAIDKGVAAFQKFMSTLKELKADLQDLGHLMNWVIAGFAALKTQAMTPGPAWLKAITGVGAGVFAGEQASEITGQPSPTDDIVGIFEGIGKYLRSEFEAYGVIKKKADDAGESLDGMAESADSASRATGETVLQPRTATPIEQFDARNFIDNLTFAIEDKLSFEQQVFYPDTLGRPESVTPRDIKAYIDRDALNALDPGFQYIPEFNDVLKEATNTLSQQGFGIAGTSDQIKQGFFEKGIFDPRQMRHVISKAFDDAMVKLMIGMRLQAGAAAPGLESSLGMQGFAAPGGEQFEASAMYLHDAALAFLASMDMAMYFDPTQEPSEFGEPPSEEEDLMGKVGDVAQQALDSSGLVETFSTASGAAAFLSNILASGLSPQAIAMQLIFMALKEVFIGVFAILKPALGTVFKPLVDILRTIGKIVGAVLTPIFAQLGVVLEIVNAIFKFLYDNVLIHVANALIAFANVFIHIIRFFGGDAKLLKPLQRSDVDRDSEEFKEGGGDRTGYGLGEPNPWEDDDDLEDEAEGGQRPTFRQQRPINVYITFPGTIYAVGEGGFREFAERITEEQKKLGQLS